MVGKKQRRGNSVACLQRNSKASLTQHKGNCLPATSFRVQGCCFSGCTPNRRGAMVVTYKIRQGERTGKLRRHTLQNAPAPKGTRVSECGQDQSGKMSSPSKSVTIKSSFFFFFVSLQTSGVAHPFFFSANKFCIPCHRAGRIYKKGVVAPVLPNTARKLFGMVAMLQTMVASVILESESPASSDSNREILVNQELCSLASYSVNA